MRIPGRLEQIAGSPRTLVDGAHNPDGARALAEALDGERFVGVVAILDDKDATAMLRELLPLFEKVVFTRSAQPALAAPGDARIAHAAAGRARRRGRRRAEGGAGARARAGGSGRRGARHRVDLPDRRPAQGACGRASVHTVSLWTTTRPASS